MPDGRSVTSLGPFPASYEAMEECVHSYQARPWPVHDPSRASTTAGIERFAKTWFPRPLRSIGRAVVTAFMPDALLRAHDLEKPSPMAAWLARSLMKTMMLLTSRILPDPRESIQDRRRRLADDGKATRSLVDVAVHRRLAKNNSGQPHNAVAAGLCPHMAVMPDPVVGSET